MADSRKNWNDFEDKAIATLVKRYGTKNWAEISQRMSSKYGIDYRSGKQCRERWHNHLDPSINKLPWSPKQEKMMFEAHQQFGNRWTEIAKIFVGRTDNDIKNHFYSMLRRSLRRINKLLGRRNSTQRIKVIKPSVLSKIFVNIGVRDHKKSFQCKKISEALYDFSSSKPEGDMSESMDVQQRTRLEQLIQRLCRYNDEYQHSQLLRRESLKSKHSGISKQESLREEPEIIKNVSKISSKSSKSRKIRRVARRKSARQSAIKQANEEQQLPKRIPRKKRTPKTQQIQPLFQVLKVAKKTQDSIDNNFVKAQVKEQERTYPTRLRKNSSVSGISMGDQYMFPDFLHSSNDLAKKSSSGDNSVRLRNSNSNAFFLSPGFGSQNGNLITGPSPRGQFRNWTPLCPSPNIADIFSRGVGRGTCEFKTNTEDLDNIMNQLKKNIEKNT